MAVTRLSILNAMVGMTKAASIAIRITSYNVCYTKLLRAFPSLVIAILITAVFGPSAVNAIIAIGIFNIPVFARVARAGALSLWTLDYIRAARVAGKGRARISSYNFV